VNWYSFASGTKGFQYGISFAARNRIRAEIFIALADRDQNVAALEALRDDKGTRVGLRGVLRMGAIGGQASVPNSAVQTRFC